MNYVKIIYKDGFYKYEEGSSNEMDVLGVFLSSDIGCAEQRYPSLKDWALADKADQNSIFDYSIGTNTTFLQEDDNGDIHIVDDTGKDEDDNCYIPVSLKMTRQQFVQLLDDWQEKVCALKPKNVIIKYENDAFIIETN